LIKSVCTYCGVGCEIGFSDGKPVPLKEGVVSKGKLCIKGKFGHQFLEHPERLEFALVRKKLLEKYGFPTSYPLWREDFLKVPYEVAYRITARELERIREKFGGSSLAVIGGARTNCESAYLLQKFAREVLKTPHVDNCARICHAPSLKGLRETVGEGAASAPFDEIYNAELIFVIGSNTTEAHPIVSHRIIEVARRGVPVAAVDVREIGLFRFSKYKVVLPHESNLLFLNALARVIVEEELYDKDFVQRRVSGFKEYREALLGDPLSEPSTFKKLKGYEEVAQQIRELAREIAKRRTLFLWGLGITEHEDGSRAVMAIANLALLTGNLGKRGCGLMPLRGQNNVQGACDVGMLPYYAPDYKRPEEIGLTTPEILKAALEGKIRGIWVVGEDLAHVHPNTSLVEEALQKLEFLAVNELFPCRITEFAHVIFGVKSCYEKEGVYVNAERRLHLSQPIKDSSLPDDWEVVASVSKEMGRDFGFKETEDVWNSLRREAPERFGGASYKLLKEKILNAPQWPVRDGEEGEEILYRDRFPTEDGRGRLRFSPYKLRGMVKELLEREEVEEGFYLTTGRNLVHYNNSNQTRRCKTLAKFKSHSEDVLYANPLDREKIGATKVILESRYGRSAPLKVVFNPHIPRGTLFTTFHHPQSRINALFGDESDEFVKTAKFKSIKVKTIPAE